MSHVSDSGQTVRRLPAYVFRAIIIILALTFGAPIATHIRKGN